MATPPKVDPRYTRESIRADRPRVSIDEPSCVHTDDPMERVEARSTERKTSSFWYWWTTVLSVALVCSIISEESPPPTVAPELQETVSKAEESSPATPTPEQRSRSGSGSGSGGGGGSSQAAWEPDELDSDTGVQLVDVTKATRGSSSPAQSSGDDPESGDTDGGGGGGGSSESTESEENERRSRRRSKETARSRTATSTSSAPPTSRSSGGSSVTTVPWNEVSRHQILRQMGIAVVDEPLFEWPLSKPLDPFEEALKRIESSSKSGPKIGMPPQGPLPGGRTLLGVPKNQLGNPMTSGRTGGRPGKKGRR